MMNDHAWTTLHAHSESEHRARALHRGGDDPRVGGTPSGSARRLRFWVSRHLSPARSAPGAVEWAMAPVAEVPAMATARRRTASDAPTAAAVAWARLASGAGSLEPATRSTTERGREAA